MTHDNGELHLYCTSCGAKLDDGAMFCQTCGAPQNNADTAIFDEPLHQSTPSYESLYSHAPHTSIPEPAPPISPSPMAENTNVYTPISSLDRDHLHVHVHTHEPSSGIPAPVIPSPESKKPKNDSGAMRIAIPIVSSVAVIAIIFGILGLTGTLNFSRNNQNNANRSYSNYDRDTGENSLSNKPVPPDDTNHPQAGNSTQQQNAGQQPMDPIPEQALNPSSQGNGASQEMSINGAIAPEAATPAPPLAPPQSPPITEAPYNSQRVFVWNSRNGWILELEEWVDGEWVQKMETTAFVGKNGISENTREGDHKTPSGTFNILFCYGVTEINTNLRFKKISRSDVFVDDADSAYYNTIVDSAYISAGTSHEKVYDQFSNGSYTICIFFDFNGDGENAYSSASGRGSVRTIRGKTGKLQETLGDIDISSGDMATLLSYLDSAKHPIIIIG